MRSYDEHENSTPPQHVTLLSPQRIASGEIHFALDEERDLMDIRKEQILEPFIHQDVLLSSSEVSSGDSESASETLMTLGTIMFSTLCVGTWFTYRSNHIVFMVIVFLSTLLVILL